MFKSYELQLPVFIQGDDLSYLLEESKSSSEAFVVQAENYEEAARVCRRMASICAEHKMDIEADCRFIGVDGPPEVLEALAKDKILHVNHYDEESDYNEDFEESIKDQEFEEQVQNNKG